MKECREFISKYNEVDNFSIYGNDKFEFSFIAEHFPEEHIDYDFSQIRIAYLDIEVGSENGFPSIENANEEVTAITLKIDGKNYVFGRGEFVHERKDVFYFRFDSERALLQKFFEMWDRESPDIVTGWNIDYFDVTYLYNRLKNKFGERLANKLSPIGKVHYNKYRKRYIINSLNQTL